MKTTIGLLMLILSSFNANAAIITLTPGAALEVSFELSAPPPSDTNLLSFWFFNTSFKQGLLTFELYDGSQLLGTDVNTIQGSNQLSSFTTSGSPYNFSNPQIIDFSSILNGTIDGLFRITLTEGYREIDTNISSLELIIADVGNGGTIYEFLSFTNVNFIEAPLTKVAEPTSILLFISSMFLLFSRRKV